MDSRDAIRFRPMLNFIARHEGTADQPGGGYNTSLEYGRFTGGEKNLSGMTLNQINTLQVQMLNHPQNRLNSSALGRYQIVRRTLRGLKRRFGLSDALLYSPTLQDQLGAALIRGRGRSVSGLRQEWASLRSASARDILRAYDTVGGTRRLEGTQLFAAEAFEMNDVDVNEQSTINDEFFAIEEVNADSAIIDQENGEHSGNAHGLRSAERHSPMKTYKVEHINLTSPEEVEDTLNHHSASGWDVVQIVPDKKGLMLIMSGDESLFVEEDDGIDASLISFMTLGIDRDSPDEKVSFDIRGFAVDGDYLGRFRDFMQKQNIRNFRPEEFLTLGGQHYGGKCKGKNTYPPEELWSNIVPTIRILDLLRDNLGSAITITSAYRSSAYNACIPGAAGGSMHKQYKAIDFKCSDGRGPIYWAKTLKSLRDDGIFKGGIGVYRTFVHVDTRGYNAQFGPLKDLVFR